MAGMGEGEGGGGGWGGESLTWTQSGIILLQNVDDARKRGGARCKEHGNATAAPANAAVAANPIQALPCTAV